jgi:hypothetical protein
MRRSRCHATASAARSSSAVRSRARTSAPAPSTPPRCATARCWRRTSRPGSFPPGRRRRGGAGRSRRSRHARCSWRARRTGGFDLRRADPAGQDDHGRLGRHVPRPVREHRPRSVNQLPGPAAGRADGRADQLQGGLVHPPGRRGRRLRRLGKQPNGARRQGLPLRGPHECRADRPQRRAARTAQQRRVDARVLGPHPGRGWRERQGHGEGHLGLHRPVGLSPCGRRAP